VSKAFTAMALLMSEDMGLSIDDPPRKYLPYFKLHDPEADARVTIRHLLSHTTGLPRMDFIWGLGSFTREELIRVLARVRPTAKLGEKFQYNNNTFIAAGELLGRAHGTTWEQAITDRLLKPLRMNATAPSTDGLSDAPDSARGHVLPGLGTLAVPFWPPRTRLAAAGAIRSNIRDMGQWVRFLLARGALEGNRLASETAIDLAFSALIPDEDGAYGLGWHSRRLDGSKMVFHGGNLAGFHSFVFLVPEHRVGFAMLANTRSSRLPDFIASELWGSFVPAKPGLTPTARKKAEPGSQGRLSRCCAANSPTNSRSRGHRKPGGTPPW
jgi:CubicO group peptidase (beta-lactamase class C family)